MVASLTSLFRRLRGSRFARDAAVMQAGSLAGTFVQAVAGVLVARLLGADLYGRYALAFSVASIATLLLGSGVADAIAPHVTRAWVGSDGVGLRRAYGFFARFMAAAAGLTVLAVLILPWATGRIYADAGIGWAAGAIVVASLVSATVFTLTQLSLQVAGRIRALAVLTFADVSIRYLAVLGLTFAYGFYGAAAGHLAGALVLLAASIALFVRTARAFALLPRLSELPALARATPWAPLVRPTLWVIADRNFAVLYGALPVAMVGLYAASTEIAYFKLAFGYIVLAMSLLGPISTLLNVKFPALQVTDRAALRPAFVRVTLWATGLSAGITAAVLLVAPLVFRILYGTEYLPAIPYVYGFGLFGALFGMGVALGPMWRAVDKVRVSIMINLAVLGAGVPLGIWLMQRWHLWGAVAMVTIWYTVSHTVSLLYLARLLRRPASSASIESA